MALKERIWLVHCMLSISQATLNRRLKDLNLEISHSFSTIDDDTLNGSKYKGGVP